MNKATEKQVQYALHLMDKPGFSTDWMGSQHSKLDATMKERSRRFEDWPARMSRQEMSRPIDLLS